MWTVSFMEITEFFCNGCCICAGSPEKEITEMKKREGGEHISNVTWLSGRLLAEKTVKEAFVIIWKSLLLYLTLVFTLQTFLFDPFNHRAACFANPRLPCDFVRLASFRRWTRINPVMITWRVGRTCIRLIDVAARPRLPHLICISQPNNLWMPKFTCA